MTKKAKTAKVKKTGAKAAQGRSDDDAIELPAAELRKNDPDKASYQELLGRIEAVPAEEAIVPRYDLFDAAIVALRLAEQGERFRAQIHIIDQALPGTADALDLLSKSARALRYIRTQVQKSQNTENHVKVPLDLVESADRLRQRMAMVLEYNFNEDPDVLAAIEFIRQGQGHQDRVNDLQALAELYEEKAAILAERDRAQYKPKDAALAHETAVKIQQHLEKEKVASSARWSDLQARANKLLLFAHDRIRRTLLLLDGEGGFDKYVSLYTATRALTPRGGGRTTDDEEAPTTANDTPVAAPNGATQPA